MKKTNLFLFAVICSLVITAVTSNVFAVTYVPNAYGYNCTVVDVDTSTYLTGFYFSYTESAVNSWNACGLTSRSVSTSSSHPNKIIQSNESASWYGLYEPINYNTANAQTRTYFTSSFRIILNTRILPNYFIQRTACHELGHALGLGHNDNGTDPGRTIMRSSGLAEEIPQTYDKNAVNYLWPNW